MQTQPYELKCLGPIVLCDRMGIDCSPKNAKTLGVLALLARGDDFRRSRRWIESLLWSDRAQAQASGSLRQALSEIRNCLGQHRDGLATNHQTVSLDPAIVRVSFQATNNPLNTMLFEGLDVRDPEFEAWLTLERQNFKMPLLGSQQEILNSELTEFSTRQASVRFTAPENPFLFAICHQLSQNLAELTDALLFQGNENKIADLNFALNVIGRADRQLITAKLTLRDGTIMWITTREISGSFEQKLFSLANEATEAVLTALSQLETVHPIDKLRERAMDELFSFDAARLRIADGLLGTALEQSSDPLTLAWGAFLRMIIINERLEVETHTIRQEANMLARKALEIGANNPTVLAIISQVNLLLGFDLDGIESLAKRGAERNPGSALAQMSLSLLALKFDQVDKARNLAKRSLISSGQSRLTHWSHTLNCLTEISSGDYTAAAQHAAIAHVLAPAFRPPMRHLYALDVQAARESRAIETLSKLRAQEPNFSLEHMRENPDYPASTLRQSGLLKFRDVEI